MRSAWILFSLLAMWPQAPQSAQARQRPQAAQKPPVPRGPQRPAPAPAQEFRIRGIVQDAVSGSPVEAADVLIQSSESNGQEKVDSVETSADGHFVFEHLPAGKYALSVRCRGYAPQKYQQHEGFSTAIAVGPQLDSENIVFPIFPEAVISGRVTDESGEAVRGASVLLYVETRVDGRIAIRRHFEDVIEQHLTDDLGRYRFGGLQKGRYYVEVSARPWYAQNVTAETMAQRPPPDPGRVFTLSDAVEENTSLDVVYPLTFYGNITESSKATTISLEPGEMVTADVALAAVPALHLRLTNPGLDSPRRFFVSVGQFAFGETSFTVPTYEAWSDPDSVEIVGVPPGKIRINVQSGEGGRTPLLFNETVNASQGMEINLNHQARGVPVSGIVKLAAGAHLPPRNSLFLREVETGSFSQAQIKPDGSFDFGDFVIPGKYVPALSYAGLSNWYVSEMQADGAEVSGRVVDLQALNPVRLMLGLSDAVGRVEGVALRDAKGAGGAMILLVSKDPRGGASVVGRVQSDSDGTFGISDVPPGDYSVLAVQNGWDEEWADAGILQSWLSGGAAVTVAPNGKPRVQVNVQ